MTRARVVVLSSLLFFFSIAVAEAACDFRSGFDLRFRDAALDLSIEGNDIWTATGSGVSLWDAAGERPVGSLALPGTTTAVQAVTGGVWAASGTRIDFIEAGERLVRRGGLDLEATVNDLVLGGEFLYAATSNGVIQVAVANRLSPAVAARLTTTSGAALSVAILGSTLYAADGDPTVEAYSIQVPALVQKIGTVPSLPRSLAVAALDGRLVVSDGQQSEIFSGSGTSMSRTALLPFNGTTAAAWRAPVHFLGGGGRAIRAVDVLAPAPTVMSTLTADLTPGNANRVFEIATAGSKLWAAAGDSGLEAWRLTSFASPWPLTFVRSAPASSVWLSATRAVIARSEGGLQRFTDSAGQFTPGPVWDEAKVSRIHDGDGDRVLTSSGSELRLWDVAAGTPASLASASLPAAVRSAALEGSIAWVVLANGTLWRVDLAAQPPSATQVQVSGELDFVAASSGGIATADILQDGNTKIRFVAGSDPAAAGSEVTIEGASNGGIALGSAPIVAAGTFRGVVLIDFAAGGAVKIVPGTNQAPIRDLHVEGERLMLATADRIEIRSLTTGELVRSFPVGVPVTSVAGTATRAIGASGEGFAVADFETPSREPQRIALPQSESRYYRSLARDGANLWLAGGERVDLYRIDSAGVPRYQAEISFSGSAAPVDFTAAQGRLFTVHPNGRVAAWRADGSLAAELTLNEGEGQQIESIAAVGESVWVSLTRGCQTTGCEKVTVIVDARSGLSRTGSFAGGAVDVVVRENVAAVVTALPAELRLFDIANPAQPQLIASRALEGNPVSVELHEGRVWVLGERLSVYSAPALQPVATHLEPWAPDPLGRLSYIDQKVRVAGSCLVIAGRTPQPSLFDVSGGSPVALPAPAATDAIRDIAVGDGSIDLLGEYSLQVWTELPSPKRARPVRR